MRQGRGIQWILFLLFALLAVFGGGCGGGGGSSSSGTSEAAPPEGPLYAGAGTGTIELPEAFFADPSAIEGFKGINDDPHARVLVLKSDDTNTQVAIVALELVRADDGVDLCKKVVNEITGTPIDNVWVHVTHAITTPHPPSAEPQKTLYMDALEKAITKAAKEAMPLKSAVIGFGTGRSYVNTNRNELFPDGKYHLGLNSDLPSNKIVTILEVATAATKAPIGFLISYGIKPTAIDNAGMDAKERLISSDVPGLAATMMEEKFGVPTLFYMPAAGDQIPLYDALRAKYDATTQKVTDNYDFSKDIGLPAIIAKMEKLGIEMGNDVIAIAQTIKPIETNPVIAITSTSYEWEAKAGGPGGGPGGSAPAPAGPTMTEIQVSAIRVGDAAFVGFKQELNALTELQLWAVSPYAHTMLVSFLNGDGKYMPDASAYALNTVEGGKACCTIGAAERLVETALGLLNGMK